MENLVDYGDSDDDSFSYSSEKRQCCYAAPTSASSACITEDKDKGKTMHCKSSTEEGSSSNSSWRTIKGRFIEMGYSTTIVEKAFEECGPENENAILEHILNNQGSPPDSSWCSVRTHFVNMGYSSTLVDKAIQECGTDDETAILESILTHQALENISHDEDSLSKSYSSDNEDSVEDVDDTAAYDGQFYEAAKGADCSEEFDIKGHLLEMGFEAAEISSAIERFGMFND